MWGLIAILIGLVYGWAKPGRQNKTQLFKTGLIVGLVVALVFVLLGALLKVSPFALGLGALGLILDVILIAALFVLGVWLGDLIEGRTARPPQRST